MTPDVSERAFENAIECGLLAYGPDACPGDPAGPATAAGVPAAGSTVAEPSATYGDTESGGYLRRASSDYDAALCLIPEDVIAFIQATQPATWKKLKQHHAEQVRPTFLSRLADEIERRGALDVLRNGVKDHGCKFDMAYFRPESGLNPDIQRLYGANMFSVLRQFEYEKAPVKGKARSLDLALFLNGIPIFTAELKNPFTGQTIENAIHQYKVHRDPREPLFRYGRCLAHFAVDPHQVYVTTHLKGPKTRFLPLNLGWDGGAGNPPVPPTKSGYATAYLWEEIWARDSVLDLIRRFIHEVIEEDEAGRKTGKRFLIFPRYQQLEAVRSLVADARAQGTGQRYLIQHSAGSGKSFTIAWLAHRLSTLHDASDERVFDSIVVITDRRVLDRQLQNTIRQFEQTLGVVENIDQTSRQLKAALESGKQIIVTTLQKFPVISAEMGALAGQKFAVIIDEAHSGQTGETSKSMKQVLAAASLEEAEAEEGDEPTVEEEIEDRILAEMETRGPLANVSMFAFTATPKPRTLELFGRARQDGKYEPFHTYSMRQAIEESFILDVLESYTTYQSYWRLKKTIEEDPSYDKDKASYLMKSFVDLHPHAIDEKTKVMVDHFAGQVQHLIGGRAKAMIVTPSRLHAVRYKLAVDRYLKENDHPWQALVAFSGSVKDGGKSYTESGMNSEGRDYTIGEKQTARAFDKPEFRFLIVASKFQTGFDQPLLHTMYVDKKLGGVNAVQTLSRLNRTHPDKSGTAVIDFANEADAIQKAFEPYYDATLLSEGTDPNVLYEHQGRLLEFAIYTEAEVDAFAMRFFDPKTTQDQLYAELAAVVSRAKSLSPVELAEFRGQLNDYVRLYAFLAQILPFADTDLEKLYVFARHLRRLLPSDAVVLPREVQENIDMESYRLQETSSGKIPLTPTGTEVNPQTGKGVRGTAETEQLEPLSRIIAELNDRFGLNLGPEHKLTIERMMGRLNDDRALDTSVRVNTRDKAKLTFEQRLEDVIQDIVNSNFELYKKITDDAQFGEGLKSALFDEYLRTHRQASELVKQAESKTLEFKSTLRWDLKKDVKDDKFVTHASLKTIAAFLNTDGGDLLIGVDDEGAVLGLDADDLGSDDKYVRHVSQIVDNALGTAASTHVDPKIERVDGKRLCLVKCGRAAAPVYLVWKGLEKSPEGDLFVRTGASTKRMPVDEVVEYIAGRWG